MSNPSMTVFVVGATGSIGSLVVEESIRQGYSVRCTAGRHLFLFPLSSSALACEFPPVLGHVGIHLRDKAAARLP